MRRLLFLALIACGRTEPAKPPEQDLNYPGIIHNPEEVTPNMVVEQHLEVTKDGRGGGFDAVLQKKGSQLLIVGLGPMGVRAFTLEQKGQEAVGEQRFGPKFPFPPRNVLVDVHRAFFKRLPPGVKKGELDGEEVTEVWEGDQLAERSYVRPEKKGAVRVFYGAGCKVDRCEPVTITIKNEWFGYELKIENKAFHFLD